MKQHRTAVTEVAEDEKLCATIADLLDIQADGGDSPSAVVSWAIQEAQNLKLAEWHRKRAEELMGEK